MTHPATLPTPPAPPSAPVDVWGWIDRQMARAQTPEEQLALVALIELIVAQEPDDEDEETP